MSDLSRTNNKCGRDEMRLPFSSKFNSMIFHVPNRVTCCCGYFTQLPVQRFLESSAEQCHIPTDASSEPWT